MPKAACRPASTRRMVAAYLVVAEGLDVVAGNPAGHDLSGPERPWPELIDRLASAPGPAGRAQVLDTVLARWAVDEDYLAVVDAVWRGLASSAGYAAVTSIAAEFT
jgi:hypothetical protein